MNPAILRYKDYAEKRTLRILQYIFSLKKYPLDRLFTYLLKIFYYYKYIFSVILIIIGTYFLLY